RPGALGGGRLWHRGGTRAPGRLVAAKHRASHNRRLGALDRRQGLGWFGTRRKISGLGKDMPRYSRDGHEPLYRRRLVGLVHPTERRRRERGRGVRPAPGALAGGRAARRPVKTFSEAASR